MNFKVPNVIVWSTPIGVILGGLLGLTWPEMVNQFGLAFVGELFLGALRFLVIPLVIASVITGILALRNTHRAGKGLGLALGYFAGNSALAVFIGLILAFVMAPGVALVGQSIASTPELSSLQNVGWTGFLSVGFQTLIPADLSSAMRGQFLGIFILAAVFGLVLATMGPRQRSVVDLFRGINEALLRFFRLLIWAAPLGLFFVAGSVAAGLSNNPINLEGLSYFLIALSIGIGVHGLVVLPVVLHLWGGKSILSYYQNLLPAISASVASGTAAGTLPITYSCVVDRNAISHRAASITLPLGSSIGFAGMAMFMTMSVIFAAQAADVSLSMGQYGLLILSAFGASFATAGNPLAATVVSILLAQSFGLPPASMLALGLLAPLGWLFGRFGAFLSVLTDSVAAAFVAHQLGENRQSRPRSDRSPSRSQSDRSSSRSYRESSSRYSDKRSSASNGRNGRSSDRDNRRNHNDSRDRKPNIQSSNRRDSDRRSAPDREDRRPDKQRDSRPQREDRRSDRQRDSRPQREDRQSSHRQNHRPDRRDQKNRSPFDIPAVPKGITPELESPAAPHASSTVVMDTPKETTKETPKPKEDKASPSYGRKKQSTRGRANPRDKEKTTRQQPQKQTQEKPVATSPKSVSPVAKETPDTVDHAMEREKARVASQLAAMKQAEELNKAASKAAEKVTRQTVSQSQANHVKPVEDNETTYPKIDYTSDPELSSKPAIEATTSENSGSSRRSMTVTVGSAASAPERPVSEPTIDKPDKVPTVMSVSVEKPKATIIEANPVVESNTKEAEKSESPSNEKPSQPKPGFGRRPRSKTARRPKGKSTDEGKSTAVETKSAQPEFSTGQQTFGRAKKKRTR